MEKLAILGSTGSIGKSTLEVVSQHPEKFRIISLAAGNNFDEMIRQVKKYKPLIVSMATQKAADEVKKEVGSSVKVLWGEDALVEISTHQEVSYVVSALVGSRGLFPTLAAIQAKKKVGIANKETLVTAGHIVMAEAQKVNIPLIPIDSEHSAILQCLNGEDKKSIKKITLTASGGAFRNKSRNELEKVSVADALNHPNWLMGKKLTIDSATMMNKGLEIIEAHWLFGLPYDQIKVLFHPQSIVHSMVEFIDGSVMAQMGTPDMKVPIQYALSFPKRYALQTKPLDLSSLSKLDFYPPDFKRFPCLQLAYEAGKIGGTMTTVLNGANEIAVDHFMNGKCSFLAIEYLIESTLNKHVAINEPTLDEIKEADQWSRKYAQELCSYLTA